MCLLLFLLFYFIYKSVIHQKTGSTQTNINKLNQRATCSQISQHGGRSEHWVGQN